MSLLTLGDETLHFHNEDILRINGVVLGPRWGHWFLCLVRVSKKLVNQPSACGLGKAWES